MSRTGSPARYLLVCAALVGLSVSSTHTAPMAQATQPTFTAATNYPLGTPSWLVPGFMALGDLNGDGYADAVTSDGSQPSQLRILFNNGAGGFGGVTVLPISGGFCPAQNPYTVPTCASNVNRMEIADFNNDGRNDIVASNNHSQNITVLLNVGGGTFAAPVNYALGDSSRTLAVGDVNNDGYPDVVAGSANFAIRPFINNGNGTFTVGADAGSPLGMAGGINRQGLAIADFNGDGDADIAVGNRDSNNVLVLSGNGAGAFSFSALLPNAQGSTVKALDVNNDGALDIVASQSGVNTDLAIYINNSGTFAAPTFVAAGGAGNTFYFDAADLNLDGNVDLVTSQSNGQKTLTLLLGNGAGGFAPAGTLVVTSPPVEPRIADLNNDGKLDIAVTNRDARAVARFLNTTAVLCAAGTYSASGNAPCTSAGPGYFVPGTGATSQTACPFGTWSDGGAIACYALDNDGDGVNNNTDAYPDSNMSAAVSIGACSTTVANQVMPNGATFNDLLATAAAGATNHGKLVSAATQLSNGWKNAGLISGRDHGAITSCVARSK